MSGRLSTTTTVLPRRAQVGTPDYHIGKACRPPEHVGPRDAGALAPDIALRLEPRPRLPATAHHCHLTVLCTLFTRHLDRPFVSHAHRALDIFKYTPDLICTTCIRSRPMFYAATFRLQDGTRTTCMRTSPARQMVSGIFIFIKLYNSITFLYGQPSWTSPFLADSTLQYLNLPTLCSRHPMQ